MTDTRLSEADLAPIVTDLAKANAAFSAQFPGESGARQPVHTVYGGAHLFRAETAHRLGDLALKFMDGYASDSPQLAEAFGITDQELAAEVHWRVLGKLRREAVEDFRIDFEDGFGVRPDAEEDGVAIGAANEVARGMAEGTLPPFIGIRIKPLSQELYARSLRTLDLFLLSLVKRTGGALPDNFVVTLPKIVDPAAVRTLVRVFEALEKKLGLESGSLKMEFMIETTQSIFDARGGCAMPPMLEAAEGRCVAAHFGVYDYTACCSITAEYQRMGHAACDFARHMMQVSFAGTGIWLSDGATNIMPAAPHRAAEGEELTEEQERENLASVQRAWRMHYDDVRHSLEHAYYQGWDLHPGQLVSRYAALYAFFLEGLDAASERLKNFVEKAAQATLVGDVFDDAATGQGLLNYFLRAINCSAVTEEDVATRTGLTLAEIRTRSFKQIMDSRRES